jgi:methionyl aminopeptidase
MFTNRIFIRTFFKRNKFADAPNVIRDVGKFNANLYAVPEHIKKPHYYSLRNEPSRTDGKIEIKNEQQIEGMRKSCKLAAGILSMCEDVVKVWRRYHPCLVPKITQNLFFQVGTTTEAIDHFLFKQITRANAYPSPLRYCGFPKSVCTSVNNIACHGIPDDRSLMDGDIINVDITVFFEGFHGDCSRTFAVGNVDEVGRRLIMHNEEALMQAIAVCRPGACFNEIGGEISAYAKAMDFRNVRAFIGHGIGEFFHGPPEIYHFENELNMEVMKEGMTFTIEPIFSEGSDELELWEDKWTASTIDGSRTAQHEHTVLITEDGVEILTMPE